MFRDVFEWLQGLAGLYPIIGATIIVSALLVLIVATTGFNPRRAFSHSLRPH